MKKTAGTMPIGEEKMIIPHDMIPEAWEAVTLLYLNWDYHQSIKKVQGMYVSWKNVSREFLTELLKAKKAILAKKNNRKGCPKTGEETWAGYIKACFGDIGPCQRTIDSWLAAFEKTEIITGQEIAKYLKIEQKVEGNSIKLEIYCLESKATYKQSVAYTPKAICNPKLQSLPKAA